MLRVFLGICFLLPLCVLAREEDSLLYKNSFGETIPGLEMIKGKVGQAAQFNGTEDFLSVSGKWGFFETESGSGDKARQTVAEIAAFFKCGGCHRLGKNYTDS